MILPEAQCGGKAEQTDNRETFALTIQIRTDPAGRGRKRKGVRLVKYPASLTCGLESGFTSSCRLSFLRAARCSDSVRLVVVTT